MVVQFVMTATVLLASTLYETQHGWLYMGGLATTPMLWCSTHGGLCTGEWNPLDLTVLLHLNMFWFKIFI